MILINLNKNSTFYQEPFYFYVILILIGICNLSYQSYKFHPVSNESLNLLMYKIDLIQHLISQYYIVTDNNATTTKIPNAVIRQTPRFPGFFTLKSSTNKNETIIIMIENAVGKFGLFSKLPTI